MQFLLKGKSVQILRETNHDSGKAQYATVGRLDLQKEETKLRDGVVLTASEKKEVNKFLKEKQKIDLLEAELRSKNIAYTLQLISDDVRSGLITLDKNQLGDIEFAMKQLKRACKHSDVKK